MDPHLQTNRVDEEPVVANQQTTSAHLPGATAVVDAVAALASPARVVALRQLLAERPPKRILDRITALAAGLLEAPIVLVTLIEADRQLFLSSWGLPEALRSKGETSVDFSICQYAVATRKPLIVSNTNADAVLATNRIVTELGVTTYAGIPLFTPAGHAIGTLCVLDVVARRWRDDQLALLADLARLVEDEIRLHHLEGRLAFEQQWSGVPPPSWREV